MKIIAISSEKGISNEMEMITLYRVNRFGLGLGFRLSKSSQLQKALAVQCVE